MNPYLARLENARYFSTNHSVFTYTASSNSDPVENPTLVVTYARPSDWKLAIVQLPASGLSLQAKHIGASHR